MDTSLPWGLGLRQRIYGEAFVQRPRKRRHVAPVLQCLRTLDWGGKGGTVDFFPGEDYPARLLWCLAGDSLAVGEESGLASGREAKLVKCCLRKAADSAR